MHSAPAVRYPVPQSTRVGRALGLLCLAPTVPWFYGWLPAWGFAPRVLALGGLVWLVAAAAFLVQWRGMHAGQLRWDGQAWWWLPDGAAAGDERAVTIELCMDLQSTALVRMVDAPGRVQWRWLERSAAPARWCDVRRALCQRGDAVVASREPQL